MISLYPTLFLRSGSSLKKFMLVIFCLFEEISIARLSFLCRYFDHKKRLNKSLCTCVQPDAVNGKSLVKCSSKGFRLRSAAFEMQLSHGVWNSPFKRQHTLYAKKVFSLLRDITSTTVYHKLDFFQTT